MSGVKKLLGMPGVKKLYYSLLVLVGFLLCGTTILVILIQIQYERNLILLLFCAVSWALYIFTAVSSAASSR